MTPEILIVEAYPPFAHLMEVCLRGVGQLTLAHSKSAARAELAAGRFDVVVTDLGVGFLGYDWVDELVSQGLFTLVLTSWAMPEDLARINRAAAVVTKPFQPPAVRALVGTMLEGRHVDVVRHSD